MSCERYSFVGRVSVWCTHICPCGQVSWPLCVHVEGRDWLWVFSSFALTLSLIFSNAMYFYHNLSLSVIPPRSSPQQLHAIFPTFSVFETRLFCWTWSLPFLFFFFFRLTCHWAPRIHCLPLSPADMPGEEAPCRWPWQSRKQISKRWEWKLYSHWLPQPGSRLGSVIPGGLFPTFFLNFII